MIKETTMTKPEVLRRSVENSRLSLLNFVSKLSHKVQTLENASLVQNELSGARNPAYKLFWPTFLQ
jgi:hypothetical protein